MQLGRPLGQLLTLIVILDDVKPYAQARILGKKFADVCGIGGGEKNGGQNFGFGGVGLRLFGILAVIITCLL